MTVRRPAGWLLAGLLFSLAPALSAHADTLAAALEQAWLRFPQARSLDARAAEAEARGEVAAGLTPGPTSLTLGHVNDGLTGNRGRREWEVELSAPLWLPTQKTARRDEAAAAVARVAARRAALRLEVAGEVREAWWNLAAARNALDLAGRRLTTARTLEADVLRRFRAGDLSRIDANLAQGERLAAEAETGQAELTLKAAEQVWLKLTGMVAPAAFGEERPSPSRNTRHEPVTDHPRLAALDAAVRSTQARLKVAEATRREAPELALRLVRERGDAAEPYGNALGVQFRLPFSSGPQVRADHAAARAELAEADAELALARQQLDLDVQKAHLDLDSAERQHLMANERQRLAADSLRLAETSFALGESDVTTLLRIRAAALEADALLGARRVAFGAAVSRFNQILGVLP
jgi:cobalt-zinc-cadmium efflux system outer membrane protein